MKYNILVIDDNENDLREFENTLKKHECNIITASSGEEALAISRNTELAVMVIDVQMPGMDGYETAGALKTIEKNINIPIIFVSDNKSDRTMMSKGYEAGAFDYLIKPVDPSILGHKIQVFLKLYEYEDELKNRLSELEHKNEEMSGLNKQINDYARQLELKTHEAEKANKAKTMFLANISHEIRTPMNAILGFTDILHEDEFDLVKKGKLAIIKQSGEFLLNLINDILDLSKIEAGKLEVVNSEFSLFKLFEEMYFLFNENAKRKNLTFSIDMEDSVPEFVFGDERYLKQVIMNLIGNSFKFTEKGGIKVVCRYVEGEAHITVYDTGIGITQNDLKKIFDAFKQVNENKTSQYKGTGLGLTISKCLIELMGGSLTVESTPGKGSTFGIGLPLKIVDRKSLKKFTPGEPRDNEGMVQNWIDQFKNEPLLKNILLRAIRSMPPRIKALEDSIKSNNIKEIEFLSHTIKGFSGSVKMNEICDLARKMEKESKNLNTDINLINSFFQQMKEVVESIPERFKTETGQEVTADKNLKKTKSQLKILVAEDDDVNQEIIKAFLYRMGFICDIASNGQIVLNMLKEKNYDILLLDIGMPVMDGMETIKFIRGHDEYKSLRVIALTAYSMKGDREKFLAEGFDDYISKPVDRNRLWEKIWK